MPKLPSLKAKELVRALNKMGFFLHHQAGGHAQFKHPNGRRTTISIHSNHDIPKGTLRAILRELDISIQELIDSL